MLISTLTLATARAPSLAGRHHLRIVESGVFTRAKRWRARDVGSRTRTCAHAPAMTGQLHASRSHRPTLMERSRGETSATGLRDRTCHCSPSLSTRCFSFTRAGPPTPSQVHPYRGGLPELSCLRAAPRRARGAKGGVHLFRHLRLQWTNGRTAPPLPRCPPRAPGPGCSPPPTRQGDDGLEVPPAASGGCSCGRRSGRPDGRLRTPRAPG